MPLTDPRPGLFRGRAYEQWAWYVVNPTIGGDPRDVERAWQEKFAATNPAPLRVFGRRVLPWIALAVVLVATTYVIVRVTPFLSGPWLYVVCAALAILGIVGAILTAASLHIWIAGPMTSVNSMWGEVLELDPEVVDWVEESSTVAEVWRLQRAVFELRQVHDAAEIWGVDFHDELVPTPSWAIEDVISPVLEQQLIEKSSLVEEAARSVGFAVPESIRERMRINLNGRELLFGGGSVSPDTV